MNEEMMATSSPNSIIDGKAYPFTISRILAGLIDYALIVAFTVFITFQLGEEVAPNQFELNGAPVLIPVAFWFLATVGMEIGFDATIGNMIMQLRAIPINESGRSITTLESFKRHLADPVDICLLGLVGILTIENTEMRQRLGDVWAKTTVVKKSWLLQIHE